MFYNGRYNEMHDFVALEILDGQVQFSFSLGTHITRAMAHVEGGVNDGNWHEVTVSYFNRVCYQLRYQNICLGDLFYAVNLTIYLRINLTRSWGFAGLDLQAEP